MIILEPFAIQKHKQEHCNSYLFFQVLEVRRSRIIMSVQPFVPVVGDVSILPAKPNSNESETYKV